MAEILTLRRAHAGDLSAVDALVARAFPRLLARDYPPSTMVTAVPLLGHASPGLVGSGRYFVAESPEGAVIGGGGWSHGLAGRGPDFARVAEVRLFVTDDRRVRRGIGRALMGEVMADARAAGNHWLDCLATRTAVPFYAALGFRAVHPVDVTLRPGIVFPVLRMMAEIG